MVELLRIKPDWAGKPCIVAAPGPSLTEELLEEIRLKHAIAGWRVLVVQDAYRVLPLADALYGSNPSWWRYHATAIQQSFWGEKWSTHEAGPSSQHLNDKSEFVSLGVNLVRGKDGPGFSTDPECIHYGSNSGFQAINLALLLGCTRLVLVGFDMRCRNGKSHFFGDHPEPLHQNADEDYRRYVKHFARAAQRLPPGVSIINATPGSALDCFPIMGFADAVRTGLSRPDDCMHSHGAESHAATG